MKLWDNLTEAIQSFGLTLQPKKKVQPVIPSPIAPANDDAAFVLDAGGINQFTIDVSSNFRTEQEAIKRYREVAQFPDADSAIEDVVNEAIVSGEEEYPVKINLDNLEAPETIKDRIVEEFTTILELLRFGQEGHDLFKKWYVDGRLFFQILTDKTAEPGIQELRPISPLHIQKVVEVDRRKDPATNAEIVVGTNEFYIYKDPKLFLMGSTLANGIKLTMDSVCYVHSGIIDDARNMVLSHLHKAVKPINMLKIMEDSLVIYRTARAPERRIFYIDVTNLPKVKAEQYIKGLMNKYKSKMVYDATTGTIKENVHHMSMMEDFWLPRRDGGKGTEVTTLPGGQTLGQIEDIQYFLTKTYKALNVPLSRLNAESIFNFGKPSEITRDEVKFSKFVGRLRGRFSQLFYKLLRTQLLLKGIIKESDWDEIREKIFFDYVMDSHYAELKDSEILSGRLNNLVMITPFVGIHYSLAWVRQNVLQLTEEEIEEMQKQIVEEAEELDNARQTAAAGGYAPLPPEMMAAGGIPGAEPLPPPPPPADQEKTK